MTKELDELVGRCASAAVVAKPGDVVALAQLHGDLQAIRDRSSDQPDAVAAAARAVRLVETVVLGEAQDIAAALREIARKSTNCRG